MVVLDVQVPRHRVLLRTTAACAIAAIGVFISIYWREIIIFVAFFLTGPWDDFD